ncbi:MAG: glycosyltransferase family 4 protein [Lachnospira sp.]|nr:glycosyltransferase family 4 protein [Lachnospira sp.]
MRNICFVTYDMSVLGGAEKVAETLANALTCKYRVYVISIFGKNKEIPYKFNDKVTYIALFEEEMRLRNTMTSVYKPLKKFLKDNNIGDAIVMGNYAGISTSLVAYFSKCRFYFCDHGALMNQWERKDIRYIRRISAFVSHKVVTLTKRSKNDYIERFHLKKSKVCYIYNSIDDATLENAHEYNEGSKLLLSVGRFGKEKGYDMLVKVAKLIFAEQNDWQWHIYGDGETFLETKKLIEENGLCDKVILKGRSDNIPKLYKDYGVFVLTSYREGLPLVLLEAKANNLPIVSFDCMTGPAEIVENNVNGYLIPTYDIECMADKLLELIGNDEKRRTFAANASKGIEQFSKETIVNKWIELIESER